MIPITYHLILPEAPETTSNVSSSLKTEKKSRLLRHNLRPRVVKEKTVAEPMPSLSEPVRWSKAHDIILFQSFKSLCSESNITQELILKSERQLTSDVRGLLRILREQVDWRGNIYTLRNRIKRLKEKDSEFTARELRQLKRFHRMYTQGKVTIDQVTDQFPGKNTQNIIKKFEELEA